MSVDWSSAVRPQLPAPACVLCASAVLVPLLSSGWVEERMILKMTNYNLAVS